MNKKRRGGSKDKRSHQGRGGKGGGGKGGGGKRDRRDGGRQQPQGGKRQGRSGGRRQRRPDIAARAVIEALAGLDEPSNATMVTQAMELPGTSAKDVARALRALKDAGEVMELRPGRFVLSGADGEYTVNVIAAGDGPEAGLLARFATGEESPVHPRYTLGARPGDEAIAMLGEDHQALLTRLVNRDGRRLVGLLDFRREVLFVPDNRRESKLPVLGDPRGLVDDYKPGDRVVGEVRSRDGEVVGIDLERRLDETSPELRDYERVCLTYELPGEFPPAVLAQAEAAALDADHGDRRDLRDELIFTIDPESAKDFDDAISVEAIAGGWRLGVHIADVSHFVRQGDAIDAEAAQRGTSTYLMNRVIPMLPEALSNGLCSLVPDQDRQTMSVFIDVDAEAELLDVDVCESVIHSQHRLNYQEALAILEEREEPGRWPDDLLTALRRAGGLTQALRRRRERDGALNLFSVEQRFELDVEGNPIEVTGETSDVAHQLIEELMLLANRSVAAWLARRDLPCVYRVHEEPDEERLGLLAQMLEQYGLGGCSVADRRGLQDILRRLAREPQSARIVLNYLMLRSFAKAHYDIENTGHYALAFDDYCHFTSPIRRYPDLLVHRLVKHSLGLPGYRGEESRVAYLDAMARRCSWLERRSDDAERDLRQIKGARYLHGRLGDVFDAVVVTAYPKGLFVRLLEVGMDARLPVEELTGDYYEFDEERLCLVGRQSGRVWGIGEEVQVQLAHVDIERAETTLVLAGGDDAADGRNRGGRRGRGGRGSGRKPGR